MSYLLGLDIGSSSVKASLVEAVTGKVVASSVSPETELEISSPQPGWAEQDPETWWKHVKLAVAKIKNSTSINLYDVAAIGLSYQMHGLVLVDQNRKVLRPSIIWCDSRAVTIGEEAFVAMGRERCMQHLLNSPGNFTASKLRWVQQNEPEIYSRIYKIMLPGDYIAMEMSGEIQTTQSGLSEGIMWDFVEDSLAQFVLEHYEISPDVIPEIVPTFSIQGELTKQAAAELGLKPGTKISYRAGDQPNNAFSLNVLHPGELAATAGTSGVVYGVGDEPDFDRLSRVNTFVHVNHSAVQPRYGVLLCLNSTGILYRWMKKSFAQSLSYESMNQLAATVPPGAKTPVILPYGNGAERTLENKNIGAAIYGLDLNIHEPSHLLRAAQEGIAFALNYGLEIMQGMGMGVKTIKAGMANMFLSPVFREAFAAVTGAELELYNTDGAQGAARGAGVGSGIYQDLPAAFTGLETLHTVRPDDGLMRIYREAYQNWLQVLNRQM